jgi:hypothetical protein
VVWAKFEMTRSKGGGAACVARKGGADLIDATYPEDPEIVAWLAGYASQFEVEPALTPTLTLPLTLALTLEAELAREVGTCVGLNKYQTPPAPPINHVYQTALADAVFHRVGAGCQITAINSAGVRAPLRAGVIQYRDVEACWPWKDEVVRCQVAGALLLMAQGAC